MKGEKLSAGEAGSGGRKRRVGAGRAGGTVKVSPIKAWVKSLLGAVDPPPLERLEPLAALVRGVVEADASALAVKRVEEVVCREFVDLNELRVATDLELEAMLKGESREVVQSVERLRAVLDAIFDREGALTLERLKSLPRGEVRAFLRSIPQVSAYAAGYTMMYGLGHPAVPVSDGLVRHLVKAGWVPPDKTAWDVQDVLESLVDEGSRYRFHVAVQATIVSSGRQKKE